MEPSFEGFQACEEGAHHQPHAERGLVPVLHRYAQALRRGHRIKPIAHDTISSRLVSASLPQNGSYVSRQTLGALTDTHPRDQLLHHSCWRAGVEQLRNATRLAAVSVPPRASSSGLGGTHQPSG
jgi:hypothetical protein